MILSSFLSQLVVGTASAAAPTNVLWYAGNQGSQVGIAGFEVHLNGIGGQLDVRSNTTDWANLDLNSYRYVVISRPTEDFSTTQLDDLRTFVQGNGILVVAGGAGNTANEPLYINVLNTILSEVGTDITLQNDNHAFLDPDTNLPMCIPGTVTNLSPFMDQNSALSFQSIGNMVVGVSAQSLLQGSFNNDGATETYTVLSRQGLVLVGADANLFGDDACGLNEKESMWENIYDLYCDRDQDNAFSVECGGFDCDDTDDTVGSSPEWADLDGDGFGDQNTPAPCMPHSVNNSGDCDDTDPLIYSGAEEVCDQKDNDCNGIIDDHATDATEFFPDFDGDGYGRDANSEISCDQPEDMVADNTDCDDGRDSVSPGLEEVCGNNLDDNCSGVADENCPTGTRPPPDPIDPEPKCGCSSNTGFSGSLMMVGMALLGLRRRHRV